MNAIHDILNTPQAERPIALFIVFRGGVPAAITLLSDDPALVQWLTGLSRLSTILLGCGTTITDLANGMETVIDPRSGRLDGTTHRFIPSLVAEIFLKLKAMEASA